MLDARLELPPDDEDEGAEADGLIELDEPEFCPCCHRMMVET